MGLFSNPFKSSPPAAPKPAQYPPVPSQLPKISAPTSSQLAQQSQPSPAAQALITPQQTPTQHLQAMQDNQMGPDMVKTLAHGMPDREGVHWATQSAQTVSDKLPPDDLNAMKAAQTWVKNPTDANKAAAGAAAAKTNYSGPGAWAAQGAAWSQPAAPGAGAAGGAGTAGGTTSAASAAAQPRMTPHAVMASVLMSSSIKANPALAAPKPQLPVTQAPATALPNLKAPQMSAPTAPQAPQATQPAVPAFTPPPTVPPAVQSQMFAQQHPFIKNGLDIASGKSPVG